MTFEKDNQKPVVAPRSLVWQYGVVDNNGRVRYPARRNKITGRVQVKLRLCNWVTINERHMFNPDIWVDFRIFLTAQDI